MKRYSGRLILFLGAVLILSSLNRAEAARVVCTMEEPELFSHSDQWTVPTASSPVRTLPKPNPVPLVAQSPGVKWGIGTGGSLSSSSSSVVSSGGTFAHLTTTADLDFDGEGTILIVLDWIFIPPRFLDGVFRPPESGSLSHDTIDFV